MGVPWQTRKYIKGSTMTTRLKNTDLRNPISTFRSGDVLGPFSESLPLNFNVHLCTSYLGICKIMAVSIP